MFSVVICLAWITKRSLNDSFAMSTLGLLLVNVQLAITFLSAPSNSLTLDLILFAIKKATSSGRSKLLIVALSFRIATHVSNSGGSTYARQTIDFNAAAGTSGAVTNSTAEDFTDMPACTVTHIGIWDASTSGNLLYHGAVSSSKTVASGDTISLAAGQLTVTLA